MKFPVYSFGMAMFILLGLFALILSLGSNGDGDSGRMVAGTFAVILVVGGVWIMYLQAKHRN